MHTRYYNTFSNVDCMIKGFIQNQFPVSSFPASASLFAEHRQLDAHKLVN